MKPGTQKVIQQCLRFKGGRSRPDKSAPAVLSELERIPDGHLLDVGCGRGSFARIIRAEFGERFKISGVEACRDYLDDARDWYSVIFIRDFATVYKSLFVRGYTAYLFIDVLEHFERGKAIEIVRYLERIGVPVIASIPNAPIHWHQSEEFEAANPLEAHRHDWTNEEVEEVLGLRLVADVEGIGVFSSVPTSGS